MSEVLDFDYGGSESIGDIIYESNMTEMELHAEDVERFVESSLDPHHQDLVQSGL